MHALSLLTIFLILFGVGVALLWWVAWHEPRSLRIRRHTVPLAGLTQTMTAVVIGDIQPNAYHWPASRLADTFAGIQASENPDVVLWLGDYFNAPTDTFKDTLDANEKLKTWVMSFLPSMHSIATAMAKLHGRLGSVAVLGNHDWAWSGERTQQRLEEIGITVLKDEVCHLVDDQTGQKLDICGYDDISSGRRPDILKTCGQLDGDAAQISLSHSPDAFPIAGTGPELMLCGHTHGGQVRFPFIGPVLLPIEFKKYDRGWFHENDRRLFVTSGMGTSLPPFRLLCPPEIVILTLVPEGDTAP